MPLNNTAIKALRPKDSRYKVFDGEGLYLEILPTGAKAPYLSTRRSVPTFRIPVDLQVCLGRIEYRRSLGPCYASEAKFCALRLATWPTKYSLLPVRLHVCALNH